MESGGRPCVGDVRDHVTCGLCRGYLVDAVTVVRCLHTFCRSCLTRRLSDVKECPSCRLVIDENRLSKEIRRDNIIQTIVYKCVPGLLTSELKRRRDFVTDRRRDDVTMTSQQALLPDDMSGMTSLCADDDDVSVCLQLVGSSGCHSDSSQVQQEQVRCRYLLCPASTHVSLLKKFVFLKFDLSDQQHAVEVFHHNEPMEDFYTLMDVAYMFEWDRSSPLMFHYIIIRRSIVESRTSDAATVRLSDNRHSVTSVSMDSTPSPARCGRSSPDFETTKSTAVTEDVLDSADGGDRQETSVERTERTARSHGVCTVDGRTEATSAREQTTTTTSEDNDDCLSISTSVTVVISRRPAPSNSSSTTTDQSATDDNDTRAALTGNQVVVNATIPTKVAPSLAPQQPEVEMAPTCTGAGETATSRPTEKPSEDERHHSSQDSCNESMSSQATTDVRRTSASSRPKRKSLESVIKSLQPTPVVTSRQPEVARSRPEVLVRPMQACAATQPNLLAVSTQAVRPTGRLEDPLYTPFSQPEVVDLRRPKRSAPTGSCVGLGTSRRKPKSLSPLQAPPVFDDPYWSDKRRRFNSGGDAAWPTSARFGCYLPPTAGLCAPAAVAAAAAARYHACMAAARSDLTRLPLYYGSLQQRVEPNGYDAPLELTTKRPRDRK